MLLRAGIFTLLMSITLLGFAHEPSVGNRMASSEIRVRIPSYAIIQFAKHSPGKASANDLAKSNKTELRNWAQEAIISNQKWIFYVELQAANPEKQQSKPDYTDTQITYTASPK